MYLFLAGVIFAGSSKMAEQEISAFAYKVEIHQVMQKLNDTGRFQEVDLSGYTYLKDIAFLSEEDAKDIRKRTEFYKSKNGVHTSVQPLVCESGTGYVRFDYVTDQKEMPYFGLMEGILFAVFLLVMALLLFIRSKILKPFHVMSELPYELSKGHLQGELKENKSRFFGKFIWGISMLQDTLNDAKAKELKLLKEKKLLLLSISHDIKIPLSTIRLYAKAIREGIYDTPEKCQYAAGQIEIHTKEIEDFVKEIMQASSEDILNIEVNNSEFYLKDYIEKIRSVYAPKCAVNLTEFQIGEYKNHLLQGDFDRAVEVLENLLENAFKYGDGKKIVIDFYEEDYCQVIRVFNTGIPVAKTELPHLFDSFFRGSNGTGKQGNGLGLYIAREIMHKMGGEIFAERCEGGMNFCIVFQM